MQRTNLDLRIHAGVLGHLPTNRDVLRGSHIDVDKSLEADRSTGEPITIGIRFFGISTFRELYAALLR